jgi:bifunctional non-homologous end joining protein LigD
MDLTPAIIPVPLKLYGEVFDDPEWIYEIKHDGFRALAFIEHGACRLVSRWENEFRRFPSLGQSLVAALAPHSAVLEGEIVCVNQEGHSVFADLMQARSAPSFYAYDLLRLDAEDLRILPLIERKKRLKQLLPKGASGLRYVDHVHGQGTTLFELACQHDLEGIVCKLATAPYDPAVASWIKVKNPTYSQLQGRGELFDGCRQKRARWKGGALG